ncbi:MAG: UDP-4-amino-4-deoxy-L-arabinose aminotransferase [Lentisphaeria bacterium]|nr:UDP-4-amino-4-deoxy-L-arabinose aminotransferase [Lentisphaeria bacterium]
MRKEFLPFTKPSISEDDILAVNNVLRSGWLTNGPQNQELEKALCELSGNKYAVALSSATAAMHLLTKAMELGPGDEVILPSMTWVSMANMVVQSGATPVFCDVDRETLLATPETIAEKITPKTKMILPVHFAGAPFDLDGVRKVAGGIPVVEDAAHAAGTYYKGKHIGSTGTAIFSFHAIKNITTGEGGLFLSDNEKLASDIRAWKFHGIGVDAFDRQNKGRSPQAEVMFPGFKYNLTDICAAIGVSQLKRLEQINAKRRELAMLYRELLANIPEIRPLADPEGYDFTHAWHLFIVRVDSPKLDRNAFMNELKAENIGTGLHFRCCHLQKFYREMYGFTPGVLPATEYNSDHICSLPLFPDMTADDVQDVVDAIKKVLA